MRWDRQRTEEGEPALPGLEGLVRSVRSPEFDGVTFHEVHARSVLNKVPAGSGVPFGWTVNPYRGCSHACTYCLEGGTRILMADGRTKALSDLKVGDEIYGTRGHGASRRLVPTRVEAHWTTLRAAYRVTLEDGTRLVAGGDHRFLTSKGWKHVTGSKFGAAQRPHLEPGTELIGVGRFAPTPDETLGYRAGYLCGMLRSGGFAAEPDAAARALRYLPDFGASVGFLKVPPDPDAHWQRGFLAGVFDIAGDYGRGVLAVAHDEPEIADAFVAALARFGFAHQVDEVPKFPTRQEVRLLGGVGEVLRFFHVSNPAVGWKRSLEGAVIGASRRRVQAIEPLGLQLPLFDITTGTGDFVADGVVSHNCFARNTHTYLDFDAGRDFDTQVVVKINAPQVLAAQLKKPSWRREHVAMGTNTDPYQRAEGRYRLMPGIITALARSGTPLSVLTKGTVLARDLPLLRDVARDVPVGLAVSIALLDEELQHRLEPGTPSPRARLELVRKAREAGLPCSVLVAPVLPWLTDSEEALDALFARLADVGATSVTAFALHLRPGAREWFGRWLAGTHPELVPRYRELYARGSYVRKAYREGLAERVGPLLRRHGLDRKSGFDARAPELPAPAAAPVEQLRLL
ncbi:intein C-terminal splicing region/intein N-terminal splicing region [Amycolatopsis tolypomycina]|uniref:Intein C-terminal splicing region/intein N-terminal splicing region n=1 Tax=Amycolatopsis tolypomycina TaxID=208445 RepID=A0A1H4RUG7_9PSEU|nr:intein-containing Rv2578c family radical SAM protein [Amycolatopsis tolypomycina]SEC35605.1 intein C-terminal splicing region/intein N-terminal splicing region [Amycolatopsis tolypomycina]